MSRLTAFAAIALLSLAIVLSARAVLLLAVTLATQDSRDYRVLVRSSLEASAVAAGLALAFLATARGRWRWFALVPAALCIAAWYEAARQWSAVFP